MDDIYARGDAATTGMEEEGDLQKMVDDDARNAYSEKTIEHYTSPRNRGRMNDPDGGAWIRGLCGDTMEIYLIIEGNQVTKALFFTDGCGPTIACGSVTTGLAKQQTIEDVLGISPSDVMTALGGLPRKSYHCAVLTVSTLHKALSDYLLKK